MSAVSYESTVDRDNVFMNSLSPPDAPARPSIPMWDSSDPDRAPPPLPLPPGTGSPTVKPNTSANIAAAAKQIVEKARETTRISTYTINNGEATLERSLIKGAHHKRMQSLQTGSVKDLRSYLDGNRTPERSPERLSASNYIPYSRNASTEDFSLSPERSTSPTPAGRNSSRDASNMRRSSRQPPRAILGENTPPSATMRALQTMQVPDVDVTLDLGSGPNTPTPKTPKVSVNYDFSSQLLNLTTIATNLQKEMAQLSRRSKDNATDLISLKEATNARDEDIRKSLRDLASSVNTTQSLLGPASSTFTRRASLFTNSFAESGLGSPPSASKGFPRSQSAQGFLDEPRSGSPSPYSVDGVASVAMLEKIIREMVTKEGLSSNISDMAEKHQRELAETARKLEQLMEFVKDKSSSQALVHLKNGDPRSASFGRGPSRDFGGEDADFNRDEILKMLQRIKDSVTNSGGLTSEVKGLVRDMRGEVLGTGRELGKKLDQLLEIQSQGGELRSVLRGQSSRRGSNALDHDMQLAEEIHRIVEDGIAELKADLAKMLKQRAEQDDDQFRSIISARTGGGGDIISVVQNAIADHTRSLDRRDLEEVNLGLDKEGILDAVKEGLKDFEPNIELQQFGLEREEVLAVLKEGLEDYRNANPAAAHSNVDKGDIYEVMQEALKDFQAPLPSDQIEQMKEEILGRLEGVLSDLQTSRSHGPADNEMLHMTIMDAIKQGFENQGPAAPRELEISRDDLFDAVKASLDGSSIPFGGLGEQVLEQLHELIDGMRSEFKQYSAANGRDTEQVLDAVKDGLESLRAEIETYVDRAQDVTGKDEIVETVKAGLEQLRGDVQGYCLEGPAHDAGKSEMLEYIKAEFEQLHEAIGNQAPHARGLDGSRGLDGTRPDHVTEIIEAITVGMTGLKDHVAAHGVGRGIDEPSLEELGDAMRVEFEQLKGAVLQANAADKNELLETIQDSIGALHSRLNGSDLGGSAANPTEIVDTIHQELESLKISVHAIIDDVNAEQIISGVRQNMEDLRTQLTADQGDASAEMLGALKEELERFSESLGSALVPGGSLEAQRATLDAIRLGIEDVKATTIEEARKGINDEQLEAIRGEFENLRASIANHAVHGGSQEAVLDAIRLDLDDMRSHLEKKIENPDVITTHHNNLLDALNDGIESLRGDIVKTLDKPLDMTVNYEILDTLKEGLAGLRTSVDKLTTANGGRPTTPGGQIVLADNSQVSSSREIPGGPGGGGGDDGGEGGDDGGDGGNARGLGGKAGGANAKRADIEKIEVLLAQLQIKVEAMDRTIQDLPASSGAQDGQNPSIIQNLAGIDVMLREIQDTLEKNPNFAVPEGAARKEDTDAIETLLINTKAQLEDLAATSADNSVSKEQMDEIQATLKDTAVSIDALTERIETSAASKTDVAVVELLAQDLKTAMDELKEKISPGGSTDEKSALMTKADLDVLGLLITDIKTTVNEMALPEGERAVSKSDIDNLQTLLTEFRESHDKLRDSYETDIAVTAKAFDDRKREFGDTIDQIAEVKALLEEVKTEMLEKLHDGEVGITTLGVALKSVEDNINNETVIMEVKEILEQVKEEFERTNGSLETIKTDQAQGLESSFEKQTECKEAVVTELSEKLDTLFDGLMAKYDDAQQAAEEKAKALEDKALEQEELMSTTKAMTDDLKLSIDTLGTALSAFMGDLPTTVEKMAEESSTVFTKVGDLQNKLDETTEGLKGDHAVTHGQIAKILAAVDCVQADLTENHPRFLVTLEEVRALINQHYTHSQQSAEAAAEHAKAVKELQEALKAGFDDTRARAEGLKSQQEELKTTLPALMPPDGSSEAEKYDDTAVHDKLDKLMSHLEEAGGREVHMQRLDEIHEKVMATAAEISAFVAVQNEHKTAENESKTKEAEELGLLLERRMERKEKLEEDITVLNEEKEFLQRAVESLKAEKEALSAQKMRLNADVSAAETALQIRREELHAMDEKAHAIERRIMEGVMNQSRMLLLNKATKCPPPPSSKAPSSKKSRGRDLRCPSDGSSASAQTVTSTVPSLVKSNHSLAMNSARPGPPKGAERRIMSLNQLSQSPTTKKAYEKLSLAVISGNSQPSSVSRSQSVKQPSVSSRRKSSWMPSNRSISISSSGYNKENETLCEEDEDCGDSSTCPCGESETTQNTSCLCGKTETTQSSSCHCGESETTQGTSCVCGEGETDAGDSMSYCTGSYLTDGEGDDDRRTSYGTYDSSSASYVTRSESDQQSHASGSTRGALGRPGQITLHGLQPPAPFGDRGIVLYAPPSDSGLGTDIPSGRVSAAEEYKKRR